MGGQGFAQSFEYLLPRLVGVMLSLVLGLLGGGDFGLDPPAALLLESQPLPGRLPFRIKRDCPAKMRCGLFFQSVLSTPESQPPLVVGLVWRANTAVQILPEDGLAYRIIVNLATEVVGPLPLALIQDKTQQAPCCRTARIGEDGQ